MKNFIITLLFINFSFNLKAQLLIENFNFTGTLTSNGFVAHSGSATNSISISNLSTNLTFPGHVESGIGYSATIGNAGGEDVNKTFTTQSSGNVYFAFLCNVNDPNSSKTGDYFFHTGSPGGASWTSFTGRVWCKFSSGNVNFGLSHTSTASYGATNFSKNTTYLLILKVDASTNTQSLYVLSSNSPLLESNLTAEVTITNPVTPISLNAIGIRQGSSTTSPSLIIDGIIVGTSWDVVTRNICNSSANWSSNNTWSAGHIPTATENVLISSASPSLDMNYEIPSGYNLTLSGSGTLTINPGKKLTITGSADFGGKSVTVASDATGSGAIVLNGGTLSNASNVTLQQWFKAQRAWRVLPNPFSTSLTPNSIISSNSAISINQSAVNSSGNLVNVYDIVNYDNQNDTWNTLNNADLIPANSCYAFFYKGLQSNFTGGTGGLNNYNGAGPSATTFSVTGTLNTTGVNITPVASTGSPVKYTLVGNPFAAPVNSIALTANTAKTYYYYEANASIVDPKIKSGAWITSSSNSSATTTIPMMGMIAYESSNSTQFTIPTSAINTSNSIVSTNLFKTTSSIKNLEINLVRNSNLHDRLIIREDDAAISNSIDAMDLNKLENPISNIYSITPNNQHLAVNTEYQFTQAIPLGINAPIGQYEFKVGANSFSNTDMVLIDHYLNQQQVLHNGASYNFEITADSNTKGEHRFEIAKQAWATNIAKSSTMEGLQILNNVVVDQITLFAAPQKQAMHYMLLDINAALIDKGNLTPGENHISTQTLAQGLYLLHVTNENAHIVYKIIKQ